MTPVDVFSDRPAGSEPADTDHVIVGPPVVNAIVCVYALDTVIVASDVVEMTGVDSVTLPDENTPSP